MTPRQLYVERNGDGTVRVWAWQVLYDRLPVEALGGVFEIGDKPVPAAAMAAIAAPAERRRCAAKSCTELARPRTAARGVNPKYCERHDVNWSRAHGRGATETIATRPCAFEGCTATAKSRGDRMGPHPTFCVDHDNYLKRYRAAHPKVERKPHRATQAPPAGPRPCAFPGCTDVAQVRTKPGPHPKYCADHSSPAARVLGSKIRRGVREAPPAAAPAPAAAPSRSVATARIADAWDTSGMPAPKLLHKKRTPVARPSRRVTLEQPEKCQHCEKITRTDPCENRHTVIRGVRVYGVEKRKAAR